MTVHFEFSSFEMACQRDLTIPSTQRPHVSCTAQIICYATYSLFSSVYKSLRFLKMVDLQGTGYLGLAIIEI